MSDSTTTDDGGAQDEAEGEDGSLEDFEETDETTGEQPDPSDANPGGNVPETGSQIEAEVEALYGEMVEQIPIDELGDTSQAEVLDAVASILDVKYGDDRPDLSGRRRDPLGDDFRIGDPVVDLATGRAMVVVDHLADRVDEYDEYDLLGNYAAQRTRVSPADPVVGCLYVASIQSEPSGPRHGEPPYAFASSRLGRPTLESVDGYSRPYDLVTRDLLERMFSGAREVDFDSMGFDSSDAPVRRIAKEAGIDEDIIDEAEELADVAATIGGEDEDG